MHDRERGSSKEILQQFVTRSNVAHLSSNGRYYARKGATLRWILIFGLLASIAPPAEAAKQLTVAQLEQVLAADVAARKQDTDIARRIAGITLTERVPQTTLARLIAQFHSSPQTSLALTVIADRSEFLDLPASELVADPVPDNETRVRMPPSEMSCTRCRSCPENECWSLCLTVFSRSLLRR